MYTINTKNKVMGMVRSFSLFYLFTFLPLTSVAQTTTTSLTVYPSFQPATIHLNDGRQLKVGFANIFLKNSGLLYISGQETKEANLKTLTKVDFKDRTYYRIDSVLAYGSHLLSYRLRVGLSGGHRQSPAPLLCPAYRCGGMERHACQQPTIDKHRVGRYGNLFGGRADKPTGYPFPTHQCLLPAD